MPRIKGQHGPNYEVRRRELLVKLRARLGRRGAMRASWRELAAAAEIGLATLAHYFGKREDIILAVMRDDLASGAAEISRLATPTGPFARSIADAVQHLANGFRYGGVGEIHALGLSEGLRHPVLGPGFVDTILEPGICAIQARLDVHVTAREMRRCDTRLAALALLSPVLVAFLHQVELDGATNHPLDIDAFLSEHVENFVRAYMTQSS